MRVPTALWLGGLLLLGACDSAAREGAAENGRRLFHGEISIPEGNAVPCINCHSVTPGEPPSIGTNLSNIGNRAATTVPGQSAEEYLRHSIVSPDTYLAGGFQEGIHPRTYGEVLTDSQINDLVAYMLTLKSGVD